MADDKVYFDGMVSLLAQTFGWTPSGLITDLGLKLCVKIKDAFEQTLSVFPDFASDCNEEVYTDVMNFLINPRFKVADERLNAIPKEERTALSGAYHKGVQRLDDLSEKLWGYGAEEDGWKNALDYLNSFVLGGSSSQQV